MNNILAFSDIYNKNISMSYSSFYLFHKGLSLGGLTRSFFPPVFISRNTFPFPSSIHILHAHENAPLPPPPPTHTLCLSLSLSLFLSLSLSLSLSLLLTSQDISTPSARSMSVDYPPFIHPSYKRTEMDTG